MKRSPGQGLLQAATTGPAGQTIASWPSQQLGRFARPVGSAPHNWVVLAAGAPGGLHHSGGSPPSRPGRGRRVDESGDQVDAEIMPDLRQWAVDDLQRVRRSSRSRWPQSRARTGCAEPSAEHDSAQPSARQGLRSATHQFAGRHLRQGRWALRGVVPPRAEDAAPRSGLRGAASVICCGLCYGVT